MTAGSTTLSKEEIESDKAFVEKIQPIDLDMYKEQVMKDLANPEFKFNKPELMEENSL